jgi:diguanylate cyclase (GGDEF)-like protein
MIDQPIADFMNSKVLQGDENTALSNVILAMRSEGQSAFIVCEDGAPAGVITERDAVSLLEQLLSGTACEDMRASEVMTSPVHTLSESACMGEVIQVMKEHGFRCVPIVDDKNALVGIVDLTDLQAAMNGALERRSRDLEVAVMARTSELMAANAKLEKLSLRDGLTGLLNRRAMAAKLGELHSLCQRYGNEYSVILLDIDHFKLFNDSQGHLQGDSALEQVAGALEDSIRVSDSVYRYGGEEFLAALPETDGKSAMQVAERIRDRIAALKIPHTESPTADFLTVSLGLTHLASRESAAQGSWEDVVERADRALYRAKRNGRNRTVQG